MFGYGGGWWLMGLGMLVFWGLLLWAGVALLWLPRQGERRAGEARQLLDARLASGAIGVPEYQQLLATLNAG